jgi:L-fuculose-phosphate aldolase
MNAHFLKKWSISMAENKEASPAMTAEQARQTVIDAGLVLDYLGLGDYTRGHVSIRVPGDPTHFYMKPHSWGLDEITHENIVICNLDGEKVGGGGRKHSEVYIHSEIFKARPDVMSVVHAHPMHCVAFTATNLTMRPVSQPSIMFYDGLPSYTDTVELVRSQHAGSRVAAALGPHKAVMMKNHGVAVVGTTVDEAVILTQQLENACRIQLMVDATGSASPPFDLEIIKRLHDTTHRAEQYTINFNYLIRCAKRAKGLL